MKKVALLAAALSMIGGSAMATTFGSYSNFYQSWGGNTWSYTPTRDYSRLVNYFQPREYEWDLDFCGCGDYWSERCDEGEGGGPGGTPEVPLPAAGFLLLGAMGGLAAVKRRKK